MRRPRILTPILCALAVCFGAHARPDAPAVGTRNNAKRTLRVMTYNIHVGVGMDGKLDLPRIAGVIRRERPDLVGLQEVDRGVERTGRVDQIAELSRLTGMEYAFAHNLNYQGGQYGVAVLSRLPIRAVDHRRFLNRREAERRGMIRVEFEWKRRRINFVTTHLDYQYADGRLFETEQLLLALDEIQTPLIVVGDFNDEPAGSSYRLMRTRFADAWTTGAEGLTYPARKPVKRIDYIFYTFERGVRMRSTRVITTEASDHLPVVTDLEIEK